MGGKEKLVELGLTGFINYVENLEKLVNEQGWSLYWQDKDWDNATLMQQWHICERTTANYRRNGLEYYKRGGRVFYTPEARKEFLNTKNN